MKKSSIVLRYGLNMMFFYYYFFFNKAFIILFILLFNITRSSAANELYDSSTGNSMNYSDTSNLNNILMIRHGRSRVRHSSEKDHIRWGLKAFDNLTLDYEFDLFDHDNETLQFDYGSNNSNVTTNQSSIVSSTQASNAISSMGGLDLTNFFDYEPNKVVATQTSKPLRLSMNSTLGITHGNGSTKRVGKKVFMENIKKNVDKGLEYLKMHQNLTELNFTKPIIEATTASTTTTPQSTTSTTATTVVPSTTADVISSYQNDDIKLYTNTSKPIQDEEDSEPEEDDDDIPSYVDGAQSTNVNNEIIEQIDDSDDMSFRLNSLDDISDLDLADLDETSRRNRINLMKGRDVVTKFLQIVETQHLLGANCTAGTALNLGEGVVDRYAQDRFRVEAEVAVNRANMLTRIFKFASPAVQASEHLLHASVLSMVEFDDDIFAAGNCFDWNRHPTNKGLFCPFAFRLPPPDQGASLAKDLAAEYHYLGNTSEWFFLARKNAEKVIAKNEQYIKAYHLYSNSTSREADEILSVKYEDGRWSKPYYDCGGGNIWMLTYTVPFFGYENGTYFFKGTSGIDIDLRRVDIDQCPQRNTGQAKPLNIFAGTDKCKQKTTECMAIPGLGFRRGSYRCVCRRGFYFPDINSPIKYFNGSTLEEEYEKFMLIRVTLEQKRLLINFVAENYSVLFGFGAAGGNQRRTELWDEISNQLNESLLNPRRVDQWKRVFQDLKKSVKVKLNKARYAENETGGGERIEVNFTAEEEIIIEMCGLQALDGRSRVGELGVVNTLQISNTSVPQPSSIQECQSTQLNTISPQHIPVLPPLVSPLPSSELNLSPQPMPTQTYPLSTTSIITPQQLLHPSTPLQASIPQPRRLHPSLSTPSITIPPQPLPPSTPSQNSIQQAGPSRPHLLSESGRRSRIRRSRISEILPPRAQRYRDGDPRSGELTIYNAAKVYECLPCAEGCDQCIDASPCVAALNWPMRTSILVLACTIIGLLPPAVLFTFKYQRVKVVRAASPALLRVIALGAFCIYCTSIVMYPPPSIYTCTARVWLREIGFSLTYGALMLKTWRISVIFRVRSAKAVKITDASLLKRLGVLCCVVGVALLVRTIVAPPKVVVGRTKDDLKAFLCKTDWWDHTFTSMEVLFLAWGVRLCIMVRKAPSEFNESRFISMAIYNEFLLTCFLNVSMLFLQSPANPDLLYIIFFCHTQLTVTLLLALIFGSKVYLVFRGGGKPPEESVHLGIKSSGAKFICRSQARTMGNPSTATSSTAQLGGYGGGTDVRLTEQETLEEIKHITTQLQHLHERAPPRGIAIVTIASLIDLCKASANSLQIKSQILNKITSLQKFDKAINTDTNFEIYQLCDSKFIVNNNNNINNNNNSNSNIDNKNTTSNDITDGSNNCTRITITDNDTDIIDQSNIPHTLSNLNFNNLELECMCSSTDDADGGIGAAPSDNNSERTVAHYRYNKQFKISCKKGLHNFHISTRTNTGPDILPSSVSCTTNNIIISNLCTNVNNCKKLIGNSISLDSKRSNDLSANDATTSANSISLTTTRQNITPPTTTTSHSDNCSANENTVDMEIQGDDTTTGCSNNSTSSNNSNTTIKRNKNSDNRHLVLDLNDRSKYTKEVSV